MSRVFGTELLFVLGFAVAQISYGQSSQESENVTENTDSALLSGSARQGELLEFRTTQLEELRQQVSTLSDQQNTIDTKKAELLSANEEIKNLNEMLTALQDDLTQMKDSAGVADSKMVSMQNTLENLEEVLAEKETLLSTMSTRIEKEVKKSKSVSEINKAYFDLQESHSALIEKWESQQKESNSAVKSVDTYKLQVAGLEQELTSLREIENKSIPNEVFAQTNEEKRTLEATVTVLQQQVVELEAQNKALEKKQRAVVDSGAQNEELQNTERRVVVLEAELEKLRGTNVQLYEKPAEITATSETESDPKTKQQVVSESQTKSDSGASISSDRDNSSKVKNYSLGSAWSINIGDNGPADYIDLASVKQLNEDLPGVSDCQDFAQQFNRDSNLLEKLSVNGFPVTVFWVKRASGALAICKIGKSSANIFRASVSRTAPSRADKAIAPKIQ